MWWLKSCAVCRMTKTQVCVCGWGAGEREGGERSSRCMHSCDVCVCVLVSLSIGDCV